MLGHLWNRVLAHYRTETVRNDMGGLDEQRIRLGVIAARVPQPTALDRFPNGKAAQDPQVLTDVILFYRFRITRYYIYDREI